MACVNHACVRYVESDRNGRVWVPEVLNSASICGIIGASTWHSNVAARIALIVNRGGYIRYAADHEPGSDHGG
jgi:hypothetical protein